MNGGEIDATRTPPGEPGAYQPLPFPKVSVIEGAYQICPVCSGRGYVMRGFYRVSPNTAALTDDIEKCRSCDGRGIVK